MAHHQLSDEELGEMDRMLDDIRNQSQAFGAELVHARRIIRLLTASQLILPGPVQHALDEYRSYMLSPPHERVPPST